MDNITLFKNFLEELNHQLNEDQLAVISCLRDHLIDYMPEYSKDIKSVNAEINRVIDNYRLVAFDWLLLTNRLDDSIDLDSEKEGH